MTNRGWDWTAFEVHCNVLAGKERGEQFSWVRQSTRKIHILPKTKYDSSPFLSGSTNRQNISGKAKWTFIWHIMGQPYYRQFSVSNYMIICIVVIIISWYLYFSISSFIIVMESFRLHSANQISILFSYLITFLLRSLPSCCWVGCGLFSWLEY